jgi:THO complex subunit 2
VFYHGLQSDRTLKRSSREKGREDRSRRTSDKDKEHERTRESDRRRRDREEDGDGRQALPEKVRLHLRHIPP